MIMSLCIHSNLCRLLVDYQHNYWIISSFERVPIKYVSIHIWKTWVSYEFTQLVFFIHLYIFHIIHFQKHYTTSLLDNTISRVIQKPINLFQNVMCSTYAYQNIINDITRGDSQKHSNSILVLSNFFFIFLRFLIMNSIIYVLWARIDNDVLDKIQKKT